MQHKDCSIRGHFKIHHRMLFDSTWWIWWQFYCKFHRGSLFSLCINMYIYFNITIVFDLIFKIQRNNDWSYHFRTWVWYYIIYQRPMGHITHLQTSVNDFFFINHVGCIDFNAGIFLHECNEMQLSLLKFMLCLNLF